MSFERLLKIKPLCKYVRRLIEQNPSLVHKFPHYDDNFNFVNPSMHLLLIDVNGCLPYTSLVSNFAMQLTIKSEEIPHPLRVQNSENTQRILTLGSCNGLMLQSVKKNLFVWNPSTEGHKLVSPVEFASPSSRPLKCWMRVYGLGFDVNTKDYKIVLIKYLGEPTSSLRRYKLETKVGIYSLREGSWRIIENLSCPYLIYQRQSCEDLIFNGALHWIGLFADSTDGHYSKRIVAFDFGVEKFKEIPLSDDYQWWIERHEFERLSFGVWRECLCMFRKLDNGWADIIVMKEYGVKESWCELYTISEESVDWKPRDPFNVPRDGCGMKLVCFTSNDKIVLQLDDQHLFLYDPVCGVGNKLRISEGAPLHVLNKNKCYIQPYMPNLQLSLREQ
ncbi:hypothetical protein Sjap_011917 [Stephania japonica]|uniref:F-box associated beta-propeller type 1 domain-containing protein n=1 Tax=Stephania japonica TaxID=461633 RepID=A0AAP0JEB0_9MAGN